MLQPANAAHPDSDARKAAWQTFYRLDAMTPQSVGAEDDDFGGLPFLRFGDAAQGLFDEWREGLEKRLRVRDGEISSALESHLAKFRTLVPALALISHLADGGRGPASEQALLRALAIAEYAEAHARRCYGAGGNTDAAAAKAIISRIRKSDLKEGFSLRDVMRAHWSNLTDHNQVNAGLDLLVDLHWLAPKIDPHRWTPEHDLFDQSGGVPMSKYLDRLKELDFKNPLPDQVSKVAKDPFDTFDTDQGGGFSENQPAEENLKAPIAGSVKSGKTSWQTRAAILEADLPSTWSDPFARLLTGGPHGDFDAIYWSRILPGANLFADQWSAEAYRLGWTAAEVFGLDDLKPATRHDRKGLAWLLPDGARVISLDERGADIVTNQGTQQRFYRNHAHLRTVKI